MLYCRQKERYSITDKLSPSTQHFLVHSLLCLVSCSFFPLNLHLFLLSFSVLFNFRSIHIIQTILSAACCSTQPILCYSCQPPMINLNLLCSATSFWLFLPPLVQVNFLLLVLTYPVVPVNTLSL